MKRAWNRSAAVALDERLHGPPFRFAGQRFQHRQLQRAAVLDPQRQKRSRQPLEDIDQFLVAVVAGSPGGGRLDHALDDGLVGGLEEMIELGDAAAAHRLGLLHRAGGAQQIVGFAEQPQAGQVGQQRRRIV